jgi:hypothetical protein
VTVIQRVRPTISLLDAAARGCQIAPVIATCSTRSALTRLQVRYKQSSPGMGSGRARAATLAEADLHRNRFPGRTGGRPKAFPTPLFAYVALLVWTCFSTAVGTATTSLVRPLQPRHEGVLSTRDSSPQLRARPPSVDLLAGSIVLGALLTYYHVRLTRIRALHSAVRRRCCGTFCAGGVARAVLPSRCAIAISASRCRYSSRSGCSRHRRSFYPLSAVPAVLAFVLPARQFRMAGVVETFRARADQSPLSSPRRSAVGHRGSRIGWQILPIAYLYFKRVEATRGGRPVMTPAAMTDLAGARAFHKRYSGHRNDSPREPGQGALRPDARPFRPHGRRVLWRCATCRFRSHAVNTLGNHRRQPARARVYAPQTPLGASPRRRAVRITVRAGQGEVGR